MPVVKWCKKINSFKELLSWMNEPHLENQSPRGVLKNFAKFTGKHLCQSLSSNKLASLRPATLLKKRHWLRCFPVYFAKFLRTPFLTEYLRWLFLHLPRLSHPVQLIINQFAVCWVSIKKYNKRRISLGQKPPSQFEIKYSYFTLTVPCLSRQGLILQCIMSTKKSHMLKQTCS